MKAIPSPRLHSLSLSRLRALTAVAEEGTYAAAGRRLGISHSAVAQQIREIEAMHGVSLFARRSGALHPTPICAQLCDVSARMQEAERDALRILGRRDEHGNRQLRVGLGNSMPGIAIVADLIATHPGLNVSVESGSHQDILAAVLQRRVDVAVLPDVPADSRFLRVPILSQEVVAIVSASFPVPPGGAFTLAQLMQTPLIFRTRGSSTQKVVDRAFRHAGLVPDPRLIADARDAVYEAVTLGIGVGFMWRCGTNRADSVRRIPVPEMAAPVDEVVFALASERNELLEMFVHAAAEFSRGASARRPFALPILPAAPR
ncbi:MAG: DNA-binding transcriptional LysR family regulator [Paracoccaceae bacterium]|jgi:DNA-binding transcriptional LysR family regulator